MTSMIQRRALLSKQPGCQFVTRETFLSHLTSHEAWDREDEPDANVLGLRDLATGRRILIPVEEVERNGFR